MRSRHTFSKLLVVAILGALVIYVAPTLGDPLLEIHAFRQTQTAYAAHVFHEQRIDLRHPQVPVLGEPFEIPFEFSLFQAVASLVMDLSVDDDTAMRLTPPELRRDRPAALRVGATRSVSST